jgi:two-component system, NarL family, nitrate/nitrite response regulator NarL
MKLLIVEDDSMMLQALSSGLVANGISNVEIANSASIAMQKFRSFKPDVSLIDIELRQGPTGVDVSHAMRKLNSNVGIVFLTSLADPRLVDSRLPELPEGSIYLRKNSVKNLSEVIEALNLAISGDLKAIKSKTEDEFLDLSKAQFEIIRLIAQGHSNQEISKIRVTTVKSTENAISRLAKKLGITNSTNASQRVLLARKYTELTGKV